jgi:hypothetical protein
MMVELDRMYRAYNGGLPLPNPGRVAKRLSQFLKQNPNWPLDRLRRAVWFRFATVEANPAEDPALWVMRLPNYAAGPLGRFGVVLQHRAGEVAGYWMSHPHEPKRADGKSWEEV